MMAKIYGPLHSAGASGKIGGNIYSRNQYGWYAYEQTAYVDPESEDQIAWRAAFSACNTRWKSGAGMTNALRQMWNEFAINFPRRDRFGRTKKTSGREEFIRSNIVRNYAGLGFHNAPPTHPGCRIFPTVTLSQDSGGIYASLDPVLSGDDLFHCSRVLNQSILRNFMPHKTKTAGVFKSSDTHPFLITPNFLLDDTTKRHFFRWRCIDGDGRPGPFQIYFIDGSRTTTVVTVYVSADTWIDAANPTTNYSTTNRLSATRTTVERAHGLWYADVSSIPASSTILSATFVGRTESLTGPCTGSVFGLLVPFVENQATWNIRSTGNNWSSPGGVAGTDYDAVATDTISIANAGGQNFFDVLNLVQSWVDGSRPNYGMLNTVVENNVYYDMYSREESTSAYRPYFQITYA